MNEDLARFVDHAREKGIDLAGLRDLLRSAGWKDREITEAICARELDLPLPLPPGTSSARDTFMQCLAFSALYTWVISLLVLFFTYIDQAFPDPAQSRYAAESARSTIRWSLAVLIVSFPLFLVVWRSLLRQIALHPEKAQGGSRRWLTYLSLFVGALTILIDLITLVYRFFEGELSTRFLLKVFVLLVITGAVILYLAYTLQGGPAAQEVSAGDGDGEGEPAPEAQA